MADAAPDQPAKPARRLSRVERNAATRRRLFEAAAKVVGDHGYAEASVARITALAGVAQGTFYNHFTNRQALLDALLPEIGQAMLAFIRDRTDSKADVATQEAQRFEAFFDFLQEVPAFLRILNEAESFAPAGYRKHLDSVATAYARVLRRARERGELRALSDEEIEALVHMLMGAREYLSRRYAYVEGTVTRVPDYVVSSYCKLLAGGVFADEDK